MAAGGLDGCMAYFSTASRRKAQPGAMQKALDMAGLTAQDIGYLNMHGTATPQKNDAMEIKAVQTVFQHHAVPLNSTKHKTGHCLTLLGRLKR